MGVELFIVALIGFMLLAALIAVEARDLLSSVICVGAAGFALSVIDLLVGAPDLAITQVVVEVVALVLLIRMVVTRSDTSVTAPRDALRTGLVLLAGGVILAAAFFAVGGVQRAGTMPPFGEPVLAHAKGDKVPPGVSQQYLGDPDELDKVSAGTRTADDPNGLGAAYETGTANAVMAILLDYRAYDTLGEATIIFVSILGAYVILRPKGRIGPEEGLLGRKGSA
ncbi:MAG TPA: hydrogen gas-evolving membrane-bound hydrogenase subunit E [Phycisphaerae bacterium]|nr:hydrogen gas-evolving membrane-bound hydrogenase subunit E [Phycisphaerae bacterium]HUT60913.1 hydrogen gas-evolving membrane-bound hydrogenase subunit E [Phycisphaerae bacterium]